jgi:hypothetical protein
MTRKGRWITTGGRGFPRPSALPHQEHVDSSLPNSKRAKGKTTDAQDHWLARLTAMLRVLPMAA